MQTATLSQGLHGRKAAKADRHGRKAVAHHAKTAKAAQRVTGRHGKADLPKMAADRHSKADKDAHKEPKEAGRLGTVADRRIKAVKDKAAVAHPGMVADRRIKVVKAVHKVAQAKDAQAAHRAAVRHTKAVTGQVAHRAQAAVVLLKVVVAPAARQAHAKMKRNRKPRPGAISVPFGTANSTNKPLAPKRTGKTILAMKTATP